MKKLVLALPFMLFGCTTIHFDHGPVKPTTKQVEKWHHIVALDLYEASEPIDLANECGDKEWVTIKTEKSFANTFATVAINQLGPFWYPKTATISCGE